MAFEKAESKVGKYSDVETWNAKGKLHEGDQVEGYYIDKETFNTKYGEGNTFILQTESGLVKLMGQSDIKNKFEDIPLGARVRVTFTKIVETKNGAMKEYEVLFDRDDVIVVEA